MRAARLPQELEPGGQPPIVARRRSATPHPQSRRRAPPAVPALAGRCNRGCTLDRTRVPPDPAGANLDDPSPRPHRFMPPTAPVALRSATHAAPRTVERPCTLCARAFAAPTPCSNAARELPRLDPGFSVSFPLTSVKVHAASCGRRCCAFSRPTCTATCKDHRVLYVGTGSPASPRLGGRGKREAAQLRLTTVDLSRSTREGHYTRQ
jgi:hypothetical protein